MAADSSQHETWYIEESTRGTTPATPAWTRLREFGNTLAKTINSVTSEENVGDRHIRDHNNTTGSVGGDISSYVYYGDNDDLLEAGMCGTWDIGVPVLGTDQLKTGTTRRYFSIMRVFNDLDAGAKTHHIYAGVEVNTISFGVSTEGYITQSFSLVGADLSLSTTAPASSTYVEPATNLEPMRAINSVIKEGGVTSAIITEYNPDLENSIELQYSIGSATSQDSSIGNSNSKGQLVAYFVDTDMYEKFLNDTASSIEITCLDAAGNSLRIVQPNIKFTGGQPDTASSGPILVTLPYQALYDSTDATNIYLERNPI